MLHKIDTPAKHPELATLPKFSSIWPKIDKLPGPPAPGQERWLFNAVAQLPEQATIVEVGPGLGRSTTAMAFACRGTHRHIHVIDTLATDDTPEAADAIAPAAGDLTDTIERYLKANDLLKYVTRHKGSSKEIGAAWNSPVDFLFLKTSQAREDVLQDFEAFFPSLRHRSIFALNEVTFDQSGPSQAWSEHIRLRLERPSHFVSIAYGRKPLTEEATQASTVHVIIPVHNRKALTEQCLQRIFSQTFIDKMSVTIVDDGSTDGTDRLLAEKFPKARVIKGDGNLWWTGAVAKALDELRPSFARNDFFLLVNNDTLLHEESVEILVRESEICDRSGISPIALDASSGQAISTGWAPGSRFILNDFERQFSEMAQRDGLFEVHTLFGRCSLFPVEILDQVRNYDAVSFPHYFGDTDFCLRARKHGFHFFVTGATCIQVIEEEGVTGVHFKFRQGPQKFADVVTNMTSIKSIDNVSVTWRYMRRHQRDRAGANTFSVFWRSLRHWEPIYKTLGLGPLPQRGVTTNKGQSQTITPLGRVARRGRRLLLAPAFEVAFSLCYRSAAASSRLVRRGRNRARALANRLKQLST